MQYQHIVLNVFFFWFETQAHSPASWPLSNGLVIFHNTAC